MMSFKQFDEATIKWVKKPDGRQGSKKVYRHVSADGNWEIKLSGMDSLRKNKDGSQKVIPTLFDKTKNKVKHPVTGYKNIGDAKKDAQRWADRHF
jgi:hypothetical protein